MRKYTNIALPNDLIEHIDQVIKSLNMGYQSRSEFVKESIRSMLKDLERYRLKKSKRGEVFL